MKLAFVYAGQGSQFAGMGKDLYENYPAARAVFDQFPADFDLRTTCFEDPDGLLNQTRYTQPCMLAVAMAITDIRSSFPIQYTKTPAGFFFSCTGSALKK